MSSFRTPPAKGAAAGAGLRETVRALVEKDVLRASAAKAKGWMVLVLDEAASRVLTPVLGLYDLVEERVTLVEALEKRRQPFPEMTAVYVVAARERSVRAVCADWRGRDRAMYADAHVFALDKLDDAHMTLLGETPELARRLRTLSELRLDFHALEAQAFDLGEPDAFRVAPGCARSADLQPSDREAARKLATVLATLGCGAPRVRYRSGNARTRAAAKLVLEGCAGAAGSAACEVLLLDRGDDALTPLVHEYSYQALVHDVLPVEGAARDRVPLGGSRGGGGAPDYAVLSDKDALWVEFRHEHVARVVAKLRGRTQDFLGAQGGPAADLRRGKGGDLSLGDMAAALRQMPEFQAATAALNKHMSVAHAALDEFSKRGLLEQSQLEQTLATGRDEDGAKKKAKELAGEVSAMLKGCKKKDAHALRLLAIYVVASGGRLRDAERRDLFAALSPDAADQRALLCLAQLVAKAEGVPTRDDALAVDDAARARSAAARRGPGAPRATAKKRIAALRAAMKMTFASPAAGAEEADVESRYAPPLRALTAALCDNALDPELYPALGAAPAAAAAPPKARSARKTASRLAGGGRSRPQYAGPKVVVCVLGGATYSELRAAYEVSKEKGREVLLGGSRFLAPADFVGMLAA